MEIHREVVQDSLRVARRNLYFQNEIVICRNCQVQKRSYQISLVVRQPFPSVKVITTQYVEHIIRIALKYHEKPP